MCLMQMNIYLFLVPLLPTPINQESAVVSGLFLLACPAPPVLPPPIYFPCSWPEARQREKIQQEFGLWKPVFLHARLSLLYTTDTVFVNQSCLC